MKLRWYFCFSLMLCLTIGQAQFANSLVSRGLSHPADSAMMGPSAIYGLGGERLSVTAEGAHIKLKKQNGTDNKISDIAPYKADSTDAKRCLNNQPVIARDLSQLHNGRLYVSWNDVKGGSGNSDVYLIYSDDNGAEWTEPIVITYRPNHKHQYMPRLAVDNKTGYVYLVYYDQQNFSDAAMTDVYLARSKNGGLLFGSFKLNKKPIPFDPSLTNGTGLSLTDSLILPFWTQSDKKNSDQVYCARSTNELLDRYQEPVDAMTTEKTVAWKEEIVVILDLKTSTHLTVEITKPLDAKFKPVTLIKNKKLKKGHRELRFRPESYGLTKGNYTMIFYYENKNNFAWIIEE